VAKVEEFAHGCLYGDYAGVVFYGPPTNGLWRDRLDISDRFIDPLFRGMLDRAWAESGGDRVPQLASDWNTLSGWAAGGAPVPIAPDDAIEFIAALAQLSPADVAKHCAGCTVEECLRCAVVVREFVVSHLAREVSLFIEDC
jgi:hypothetical protein